jgi:hypothetical protein
MRLLIITAISALFFLSAKSQLPVGEWREHLPYSSAIDVCAGDGHIYCATPFAMFSYNTEDQSIERLSKANKLSDTGISAINYDETSNTLIVGYENGNLDLIINGNPINLGDIERSNILGNKSINAIHFYNGYAYLACGFGIVQLDYINREIKDTFLIGESGALIRVFDIDNDGEYFYAATENGIYTALVSNPFLANFISWSKMQDLPEPDAAYSDFRINTLWMIAVLDNDVTDRLFYKSTTGGNWSVLPDYDGSWVRDIFLNEEFLIVGSYDHLRKYNSDLQEVYMSYNLATIDLRPEGILQQENGDLWLANGDGGLIASTQNRGDFNVLPAGPAYVNVRRIDAYNHNVWVASGGVSQSWLNNFDKKGFYGLVDETWKYVAPPLGENSIGSVNDIMDVAIDPMNNKHLFFGSFEEGLVEMLDGVIVNIYNEFNSTIKPSTIHGDDRYMIVGLDFDELGNLWFSNAYSEDQLHVKKTDGGFVAFSFSPAVATNQLVGDVMATRDNNQVWMILPNGKGIAVLDHKGSISNTNDDAFKILLAEEGQGALPAADVYSMEEDLDGEIWVGTSQGPAVFYTPASIFEDESFDAQQILIEQDGNIQILLETELITAIEIDGGNRKWIGTSAGGIFLMSPDGLEQISRFTISNSPLLSNSINDIAINHENGEVYFSSEKGLISFRGTATNFDQEITEIAVFPNPVRPEYNGVITIDGLAYDSDVKITDISGNFIYETRSNGGRATWNGQDYNGQRVASGIYLVFATTLDGAAGNVGKIAFVK